MRFSQSRLSTIAVFWVVVLCNIGTSILICEEPLIHEYPSIRRHMSQARRQQSSWYAMSTVPIKCSSDNSSPKKSRNRWCLLQAETGDASCNQIRHPLWCNFQQHEVASLPSPGSWASNRPLRSDIKFSIAFKVFQTYWESSSSFSSSSQFQVGRRNTSIVDPCGLSSCLQNKHSFSNENNRNIFVNN